MKSVTSSSKPKLIWLFFMHRHGDRSPINMGSGDKYNDLKYWPEGYGNLDNSGRLRMYKLGKFIRRKYDSFLSENFREIYSRSSDVERCIESSQAVLAGLYPPNKGRFRWTEELNWIPAPIHTVPAPDDYVLNEAGRKYIIEVATEIQKLQKSDRVKELFEESVNERQLLQRELGYDFESLYRFTSAYSTLDIEEKCGLTMPIWYNSELKRKLYRYAGLGFSLAGGGTERLKQIRCGHLLDDIIKRMELASVSGPRMTAKSNFQQPTNAPTEINDRKVVHYSTHDSVLSAFLEALRLNDPPIPPGFGATFFIELYANLDDSGQQIGDKYLKLYYMDDTESENPIEKQLPDASLDEQSRLTLASFTRYVDHLLPRAETSSS